MNKASLGSWERDGEGKKKKQEEANDGESSEGGIGMIVKRTKLETKKRPVCMANKR